MSNINTVALTGNLTRDPELRHTNSGTAICQLGLAVNRSVKRDDEWQDEPSFFEVKIWGGRGEAAANKLSKGSFISLSGRLEQERWETPEGDKRSRVVIVAERIEGQDFFKKSANGGGQATLNESGTPAAASDDDIPF